MTDHSVPTEGEMNSFRQMFERAANAITEASTLGRELIQLRGEFETLKLEVNHYHERIFNLTSALDSTRKERDDAKEQVTTLTVERDRYKNARDVALNANNEQVGIINNLEAMANILRTERDNAELSHMEAVDKLKAITDKFQKALEAMDELDRIVTPLVPEPVRPEPVQEATPHPTSPPTEPDWTKPYHYDSHWARYVNDDLAGNIG